MLAELLLWLLALLTALLLALVLVPPATEEPPRMEEFVVVLFAVATRGTVSKLRSANSIKRINKSSGDIKPYKEIKERETKTKNEQKVTGNAQAYVIPLSKAQQPKRAITYGQSEQLGPRARVDDPNMRQIIVLQTMHAHVSLPFSTGMAALPQQKGRTQH